jgi:hypothetical protein
VTIADTPREPKPAATEEIDLRRRLEVVEALLFEVRAQQIATDAIMTTLVPLWLEDLPAERVAKFFDGAVKLHEMPADGDDPGTMLALRHAQRIAGEIEVGYHELVAKKPSPTN